MNKRGTSVDVPNVMAFRDVELIESVRPLFVAARIYLEDVCGL